MTRTYKLSFVILCKIILPVILCAQTQTFGVYTGNIPAKSGIQIKWFSKQVDLEVKYDLYRKSGNESSWVKINTAPIERAKVIPQSDLKTSVYKTDTIFILYNSVMNQKEDDPDQKKFLIGSLVMRSLTDNRLANYLGLYFEDMNVQTGNVYSYRLTLAGTTKEIGISEAIQAGAYVKTSAPELFQLRSGDQNVQALWKFNAKYPLYKIYRATSPNGQPEKYFYSMPSADEIKSADTSNYFFIDNDSLLQNGRNYFYKVCSIDYFGNESSPSPVLKGSPKDMTAPIAIQGLVGFSNGKNVKLAWLKNTDADLRSYTVYRSLIQENGYERISSGTLQRTDTVFVDAKVQESTNYYYYVEAEDLLGNKSKSIAIHFTTSDLTAPAPPSNVVARADTGRIYLTWNKNTETDLDGYYVYSALKNSPDNFNLMNKTPIIENHFTDTLPKELDNYFVYKVAAADKNFNIGEMSPPVYIRMPDVTSPSPPVLKKLVQKDNSVVIIWGKHASLDIKGYEVQRKEGRSGSFSVLSQRIISAKDTAFTDDKAEDGITYTYVLFAIDSAGNRSFSSQPLSIVYSAKQKFDPALHLSGSYDASKNVISLSWKGKAGDPQLAGYILFRKTGEGNFVPVSSTTNDLNFNDEGIEKGKEYVYQISVISKNGDLTIDPAVIRILAK